MATCGMYFLWLLSVQALYICFPLLGEMAGSGYVYNALQDARAAKCKTVSGVEMFIGQAAEQFELFTAQKAPVDLMRHVVLKSLQQ